MYLKTFQIHNVKCFERLELHFPCRGDDFSGWIVVLGANGTGKSTLLQAMALTLVGPLAGQRLLIQPDGWVRLGARHGGLGAQITRGEHDSAVGQPRKRPYSPEFVVTGNDEIEIEGQLYDQPQLVQVKGDRKGLAKGPYAAKRPGWFCCGYGPFRRLSGGAAEESKLVYASGREARFATLFREAAALTNCSDWLVSLYSRSKDPNHPEKHRAEADLALVRRAIDDLLPGEVKISRIDSEHVFFHTIGGGQVVVPDLSDGYRSFLALAIDVLRHLQQSGADLQSSVRTGADRVQIHVEGVVLIDEACAHLHPRWQREIGFRLCRVFPRIQFIVTSHSPFVAQAATDGGLIVLRPSQNQGVVAVRPVESIRGWRVDQILTSPLFDLEGTRDQETEGLVREHAELAAKREWHALTEGEQGKLADLETKLAERLTAPGESTEDQQRQGAMQRYVDHTLRELKPKR